MKFIPLLIIFITMLNPSLLLAQFDDEWDNILYYSNRIAWGHHKWRHSTEFQARFNNNMGGLELWFIEYASSYLASKNWEIAGDFRFSRQPRYTEYRPGIGVLYKSLFKKSRLIQQVKYQADFESTRYSSQGLRYGLFYNYLFSEKVVGTALAGGLFEFGKDFSGFLGFRGGASLAYIFNQAHAVNVGYFYGAINKKNDEYTSIGIVMAQLVININKDYKYVPSNLINF